MRGKNPVDQGKSKTWRRVSLANLSPYVPSDNLLVHQLSQGRLLGFNMLRELLSRLLVTHEDSAPIGGIHQRPAEEDNEQQAGERQAAPPKR